MAGTWGSIQLFTWMLRIQTQILMLARQAFYLPSVPSSQSRSAWLLTSSADLTSKLSSTYLKPSLDLTQEPQTQLLGNQFHLSSQPVRPCSLWQYVPISHLNACNALKHVHKFLTVLPPRDVSRMPLSVMKTEEQKGCQAMALRTDERKPGGAWQLFLVH